jgi:DNA polymerase-3 subunit delta'
MTSLPPREAVRLIGHGAAERTIQAALGGQRLHHAWLITGPEGVGKATLAFRFARALLAGSPTLDLPATHPVFRRVAAGTHADLLTIQREWDDKKKRLKKNIAAESVREIPPFLHLTAAEGGWRVVIVDGAEDMSIASANAILKVLEEPPPRTVLMLISAAPGRLLPTIRSRCRPLALTALNEADMRVALAAILPDLAAADRDGLARLADGAPGRALALAERGGLPIAAMVTEIIGALPDFKLLRGYEMADSLRDEVAFDLFFVLLRQAIADAVTANCRGSGHGLAGRRAVEWCAIWFRIGEIHADADRHNLDKRQAVMTALGCLA